MSYWNEGDKAGVDSDHPTGWGRTVERPRKWLALGRATRPVRAGPQCAGNPWPVAPGRGMGLCGGANAVHFCREVDSYCGIDISQASLDECARVLGGDSPLSSPC